MRSALLAQILAALALLGAPLEAQQKGSPSIAPPESRPNEPAPAIVATTVSGEPFRLADACAEGYVLLVFVRGMW